MRTRALHVTQAYHSPLVEPILDGRADLAVGTRFVGPRAYRTSRMRRIGIELFARFVSLLVRQKVTDTTSGFRAANRQAILLFAVDYPHDYPEVEARVLVHRHRLTMVEVPVATCVCVGSSEIESVCAASPPFSPSV